MMEEELKALENDQSTITPILTSTINSNGEEKLREALEKRIEGFERELWSLTSGEEINFESYLNDLETRRNTELQMKATLKSLNDCSIDVEAETSELKDNFGEFIKATQTVTRLQDEISSLQRQSFALNLARRVEKSVESKNKAVSQVRLNSFRTYVEANGVELPNLTMTMNSLQNRVQKMR